MSDNRARGFLEDIVAHPDDDTARLIFADWLEEQGASDRAEFIRVQIERASLPTWDARQVRLRLRERALLDQHGSKWKGQLPSIKGITWEEFRRGFVAAATFPSFAVLRKNASACWAAAPIEAVYVRWPQKRDSSESIAPIVGLRELSITEREFDPRDIDRLANSPLLSTLQALNIHDSSMDVLGFHQLVASPHLGNLLALRLPSNNIGNGGIEALFHAASLNSVTEIDLSETGAFGRYGEDPIIGATGLEELTTWPGMTRLRSLKLSGHDIRQDGLRALLRSPRAGGLKELVLRANGLNGQAMQEFGAARPGLRLDVLDLGKNVLEDNGAAYLANAPCLGALKVLQLDRCEMSSAAARRLAWAPFLGSLRRLNVSQNSFGPQGLRALLEQQPQELHTLQLHDNDMGDEAVAQLAESPASDTLRELNLGQNGLGNHTARALAGSNHLRNLLVLSLGGNRISKEALAALSESPLGKRLAVLEIGEEARDNEIPW